MYDQGYLHSTGQRRARATLIITDNTPARRMNVALNGFGVKPAAARAV